MSLCCPECREPLTAATLRPHLEEAHLGTADLWACGICRFTGLGFAAIAGHCLARSHLASAVRRTHESDLLAFLVRLQAAQPNNVPAEAPRDEEPAGEEAPASAAEPAPPSPIPMPSDSRSDSLFDSRFEATTHFGATDDEEEDELGSAADESQSTLMDSSRLTEAELSGFRSASPRDEEVAEMSSFGWPRDVEEEAEDEDQKPVKTEMASRKRSRSSAAMDTSGFDPDLKPAPADGKRHSLTRKPEEQRVVTLPNGRLDISCLSCPGGVSLKQAHLNMLGLVYHVAREHRNADERAVFECNLCPYSGRIRVDLCRHLEKKHARASKDAEDYSTVLSPQEFKDYVVAFWADLRNSFPAVFAKYNAAQLFNKKQTFLKSYFAIGTRANPDRYKSGRKLTLISEGAGEGLDVVESKDPLVGKFPCYRRSKKRSLVPSSVDGPLQEDPETGRQFLTCQLCAGPVPLPQQKGALTIHLDAVTCHVLTQHRTEREGHVFECRECGFRANAIRPLRTHCAAKHRIVSGYRDHVHCQLGPDELKAHVLGLWASLLECFPIMLERYSPLKLDVRRSAFLNQFQLGEGDIEGI